MIVNLVETIWLTRYPQPTEIKYDQGSKLIGQEFKNYLIQKDYKIKVKPSSSVNPNSNVILERIHSVLGNFLWMYNIQNIYVDKDDPWMVILAATPFTIWSTANIIKGYTSGQLVLGRGVILPIRYNVELEIIHQWKKTQISYDDNRKNMKIVYYDYKVGDNIMLKNKAAYKY